MLFEMPLAAGGEIVKDRCFLNGVRRKQVVDYVASDKAGSSDDEETFPASYFKPVRQPTSDYGYKLAASDIEDGL